MAVQIDQNDHVIGIALQASHGVSVRHLARLRSGFLQTNPRESALAFG
jgi:hypothetical protein